jgi:oligoendopeptidase F
MIKKMLTLFCAGIMICAFSKMTYSQDGMTRDKASSDLKWDLSAIYPSWNEWKSDKDKVSELTEKLVSYQGKIGQSSDNLLNVLKINEEISKIAEKLYCYPYLARSVDSRNQEINGHFQEIMAYFSGMGTKLSWITPEMLEIPQQTTEKWMNDNPAFEPYRFSLTDMYRQQKHVLDKDKEKLLSYFSLIQGAPGNIYTELATSDIKFPDVTFSDGKTINMTQSNYTNVVTYNKNQDDRRKAYEAYYSPYKNYENTYAAILNSAYQGDWAGAQARNYPSFLNSCLYANDIPESVYTTLIKTAKENTEPLRRYLRLRKQVLGLQTYYPYDGSISLTDFDKKYPYDEARKLVLEAVAPLGKEYQGKVAKALEKGWIDVYEGQGKESNAYSLNVYGAHPYILLTYDQTMNYVFTLAHELGHSMHSIYSSENQPYSNHQYTSFVAEVASNFNEELLLDYMLKNSKDHQERIALLNQAITNLVGSFYRQSQFADFEYQARTKVENGEAVNASTLKQIADDLNKTYNGNEVAPTEYSNNYWAMVMHFYQLKYYVYQYATSFAAASDIFQKITSGSTKDREKALTNYLTLLKSGGNDYPIEQLKKAGVDMTQPEPLLSVVKRLDYLVTELEKELKAIGKI